MKDRLVEAAARAATTALRSQGDYCEEAPSGVLILDGHFDINAVATAAVEAVLRELSEPSQEMVFAAADKAREVGPGDMVAILRAAIATVRGEG